MRVVRPTPAADVSDAEVQRRAKLLTMEKAAEYLCYAEPGQVTAKTANAAYCFLRRRGVRLIQRGNRVLVRVGTLDDELEQDASDLVDRARRRTRG
jgi:hypothetical protein